MPARSEQPSTDPRRTAPRALPAIRSLATVVALEALRGRLPWLIGVVLLAGFGIAEFAALLAITESREVARGVLGAWLRLAAVFVVAVFVAASTIRDWADKGMELVLSLAHPRAVYLLGRLAGYALVALGCAGACTALVLAMAPGAAALAWGAALAGELLIVAATALLFALTFSSAAVTMSALMAFYLLARSMNALALMSASPLAGSGPGHEVITFLLEGLAFVLPSLDRFARSEWLIHAGVGAPELAPEIAFVLGQTLVYLALLGGAALFDLERKVL